MVSADLQWALTKKNNAFLVKQQQVPTTFSRERGNIANVNTFQYSSVNPNAVGVAPAKNGKGIELRKKNPKASSQALNHRFLKSDVRGGSRRVAGVVSKQVAAIRPDLYRGAVTKAQTIVRAQHGGVRPRPGRKTRGTKKLVVKVEETA